MHELTTILVPMQSSLDVGAVGPTMTSVISTTSLYTVLSECTLLAVCSSIRQSVGQSINRFCVLGANRGPTDNQTIQ